MPRLEVWNPRPMSPGSLKNAMSELSISSNPSVGSSLSSLCEDHPSSSSEGRSVMYRTNSLTFYEEEEEGEGTEESSRNNAAKSSTYSQRRASVDLVEDLVAARRRMEALPQTEGRSSSLPNFKKAYASLPTGLPNPENPMGSFSSLSSVSSTSTTRSSAASFVGSSPALAVSAKIRLQSNEGLSQEVIDRKAKAMERVEFAKNKKQQMLIRRHSSPNFHVNTSDKTLFAITEVSEPELVSQRTVPTAAAAAAENESPDAESPKLCKRFQRRANSMGLTSTLDEIVELDEESKEALRRRSISEGTYRGKPKKLVVTRSKEEEEKTKRRSFSNLFKGLRRLGSKSKLVPASDK